MRLKSKHAPAGCHAVSQLCPACGLCCNGVLFADVDLRRGDDTTRLQALGVKLFAKAGKQHFRQPCACFDGRLCRIYAERPERCRTFECRLLQRVAAGDVSTRAALKAISRAGAVVKQVRRLVRKLGETDESLALSRRCACIMAQPMDLAGDEAIIKQRSELMLAVDRLAKVLERDFLA